MSQEVLEGLELVKYFCSISDMILETSIQDLLETTRSSSKGT